MKTTGEPIPISIYCSTEVPGNLYWYSKIPVQGFADRYFLQMFMARVPIRIAEPRDLANAATSVKPYVDAQSRAWRRDGVCETKRDMIVVGVACQTTDDPDAELPVE